MAVSGVVCQQGVEGYDMAVPGETLGSPWPPLAIRPWNFAFTFILAEELEKFLLLECEEA
jgi:hypothetical protein